MEQSVPHLKKKEEIMKLRIVENLPRLTLFKEPILERHNTHSTDVEMELSCSVCNTKFQELDDFFMVWFGNPDTTNCLFETPEQTVCERKSCQTTSWDKGKYKLDWYRKYR